MSGDNVHPFEILCVWGKWWWNGGNPMYERGETSGEDGKWKGMWRRGGVSIQESMMWDGMCVGCGIHGVRDSGEDVLESSWWLVSLDWTWLMSGCWTSALSAVSGTTGDTNGESCVVESLMWLEEPGRECLPSDCSPALAARSLESDSQADAVGESSSFSEQSSLSSIPPSPSPSL